MNRLKTTSKKSFILGLCCSLALLVFTAGCGGGGGGPKNVPGVSLGNTSRPTGQANFTVVFPPKDGERNASAARQANALPPEAQTVEIQLFKVVNGVRNAIPEKEEILERPNEGGGPVSVKFILEVGRYIVQIRSRAANGDILGVSSEPVKISAFTVTTVPTTLGILFTRDGFVPSRIELKTGERLVIHHDGEQEGDFRLSGVSDCKGNIARTGSLACTIRHAGSFQLRSPGGAHSAQVVVTQNDNLLATAKPSLGIRRSEGVAEGGRFIANFLLNNGGQAFPAGATFDPGDGRTPIAPLTDIISVSYSAGSFVAAILDSAGNPLAQRYIAIYPPAVSIPTSSVSLAQLPPQVTSPSLLVSGATNPPVISGRVIVENAGAIYSTMTNELGNFTLMVVLRPGANALSAYLVNEDGVGGPKTDVSVELLLSTEPGVLAQIEVKNLPEILVAGQPVTFEVLGYDALEEEVEFSHQFVVEGLDVQPLGPSSFMPITAGVGQLIISGPGGVRAIIEIQVEPGQLAELKVSPGNVTVQAGEQLQFTVFGKDAFGNLISTLPTLSFSGTEILQSVDQTGSVLASQPGAGIVTILGAGGLKAEACVSVNTPLNTVRLSSTTKK